MSDGSTVVDVHDVHASLLLLDTDAEAIRLFEQAMEKESNGSMSDAVDFYRRAFKLNERVDFLYRKEKVPVHASQLKQHRGKNSVKKVNEEAVRNIDVDQLLQSYEHCDAQAPDPANPDHNESVTVRLAGLDLADPKPVSPLVHLPNEIWLAILEVLVATSPEAWFNFSITCKKHAFIGFGSKNLWRQMCELVYPAQNYAENKMYLEAQTPGFSDPDTLPVPRNQLLVVPQYKDLWKYMIQQRPFIKFCGCYISVVNYYSEGGKAEFSLSWTNPVRLITYYRYLRFYPDGTCIKLLTDLEPVRVVPHFLKYNSLRSVAPVADVKGPVAPKEGHRIYHGSWTISTSNEVHVAIHDGAVPYYTFHYHYRVGLGGGVFKHNKLNWIKYYAIRKKMSDDDDREGEEALFLLRNETAFRFSRVRSYSPNN